MTLQLHIHKSTQRNTYMHSCLECKENCNCEQLVIACYGNCSEGV